MNFIGRLSDRALLLDLNVLYGAAATVRVVFAGSRAHFSGMNRAIAANQLRPVIDRLFSFDEAIDAFRYYEAGQAFGKVVISHKRASESTNGRGDRA